MTRRSSPASAATHPGHPVTRCLASTRYLTVERCLTIGRLRAIALCLALPLAAATGSVAEDAPPRPADVVSVVYGPSLERVVTTRLAPEFTRATGIRVDTEVRSAVADLFRQGAGAPPDVALATDPEMLRTAAAATEAPYYLVFAADAMVLGYRRDSPFGRALAAGKAWFEALRAHGVRLGRPDPAKHPLGQRTVFVLQLAQRYYDTADLVAQILRPDQIVPEVELVPRLQRAELDVALLYRSQAVEAGLPLLDLPVEINLSDPGRRGVYAEATLDVAGELRRGAPIAVAAIPFKAAPHTASALRFVDFLGSRPAQRLLDEGGYVVLPGMPLRRAWGEEP